MVMYLGKSGGDLTERELPELFGEQVYVGKGVEESEEFLHLIKDGFGRGGDVFIFEVLGLRLGGRDFDFELAASGLGVGEKFFDEGEVFVKTDSGGFQDRFKLGGGIFSGFAHGFGEDVALFDGFIEVRGGRFGIADDSFGEVLGGIDEVGEHFAGEFFGVGGVGETGGGIG